MNTLFLIPAIISSIITIGLGLIPKVGKKLIFGLASLLTISTLILLFIFLNSTEWAKLGYGILLYISGASLLSNIITNILQQNMLRLFGGIVIINVLALIVSMLTLGVATFLSGMFLFSMYICIVVVMVNVLQRGIMKLFCKKI
jgi:phosphatidylserine synthase